MKDLFNISILKNMFFQGQKKNIFNALSIFCMCAPFTSSECNFTNACFKGGFLVRSASQRLLIVLSQLRKK